MFQNPNFVRDLNQTLQNQYFGTNKSVNAETEKDVKTEMVETMRALQHQIINGNQSKMKGEEKMSFDYKPVSLEEYNQSLRDAVNAYYSHAINDPSMRREDALKSTGEMAEKYLDAVQEFQEAQEAQNAIVENYTEIIQETTEVENGTVTETSNVEATSEDASVDNDGLDGGEGCDGGMDP